MQLAAPATCGLPKLRLLLASFRTYVINQNGSDLMNFACIVKFCKQYFSCNMLRAYCMGKLCFGNFAVGGVRIMGNGSTILPTLSVPSTF